MSVRNCNTSRRFESFAEILSTYSDIIASKLLHSAFSTSSSSVKIAFASRTIRESGAVFGSVGSISDRIARCLGYITVMRSPSRATHESGKPRSVPTKTLQCASQRLAECRRIYETIPLVFLVMCNERRVLPHLLANLASYGNLPAPREETHMV